MNKEKLFLRREMSSKNTGGTGGFLESVPRLNPALLGVFGGLKDKAGNTSVGGLPWWVYLIAVLLIAAVIWYLSSMYWLLESPANVRTKLRAFVEKFNKYADQRSSRKGIRQYLADVKKTGVPDSHLALTNFYVCSANSAATFTPLKDGIVSPEAVRLAISAGARYLDITIYPLGKRNKYTPVVCEMEPGSPWKRTTMNQTSFRSVMQAVQQHALSIPGSAIDINESPYREDPLFIMLRFNGKPRLETFNEVAKVLRDTIEPARLDFTWYGGRSADRLFKTPITEFIGKVVIMSNVYPPIESKLSDYINVGPRNSSPLEFGPSDIMNIPDTTKGQTIAKIQQNLTVCRTVLEEPDGNVNGFDWTAAQTLGIHFTAMNFWSEDEKLTAYRAPAVFGVNSFLMKPASLRYVIQYIAPPADPNPRLNAGDGTPAAPPPINTSI